MKPYYQDDHATIYHGDCLDVMRGLQPVDTVITDPPYSINKEETDCDTPLDWIPYAQGLSKRIMCITGTGELGRLIPAFGDSYRDLLVLQSRSGSVWSALGNSFYVVVCAGRWTHLPRQCFGEYFISASEVGYHPTPKSLMAMHWLVKHYTQPEETLLDCFAGGGTTLVAARVLKRKCIGIEIEERFCETAANRLRGIDDYTSARNRNANTQV